MDVVKVFHMTGGNGLTSYTNNSDLQKKASDMVKHITLEAVKEVYRATRPKSFAIADMGCSSGPNTVSIVRDIIESVHEASREIMSSPPEFIQVFLNDLPSNDFNSVFKSLPDFSAEFGDSTVLVGGYPGSFYRRLFPNNCLHFVYSSHSVHWLSKVPPALYDKQGKSINKGAIYISERSPKEVSKIYLEQFKDDFSMFLRKRCEEMVSGGKMVLILNGRVGAECVCRGNTFLWDILSRSLAVLVSEGLIAEEKIDSYDANFYAPSKEELECEVMREGSFELERSEMFEVKIEEKNGNAMTMSYGTILAKAVRAIQESMIRHHFGGAILDRLFEIYGTIIDEEMAREELRPVVLVIVLKKL